jgi:GDP-L-fucose synthase
MTILVTGGTGLVGSALVKQLSKKNYRHMAISSQEVNLLDRSATFEFVKKTRPSVIINSAGIVRGISANINFPSSILSKNIQIQTNLIDAAHEYNIEKFVFIGSSCVYPRNAKQPMIEESLMTGVLEPTNSAFAIAKIAGLELVKSYRTEFKHQWISVILNNVYGPNDNFDQGLGHVISSLISKFTKAILNHDKSVTLLGDGSQIREFLYADDAASAIIFCLENYNGDAPINIGSGNEIKISTLANLISKYLNFKGEILWDRNFSGGMPKKVLNSSKIMDLGWRPEFKLENGLKDTIEWYKKFAKNS